MVPADETPTPAPAARQALTRIGAVWLLVFGLFVGAALAAHQYGLSMVDHILRQNPRLLYEQALVLYSQQRDFQGALTVVQSALAQSPNNHRLHFLACNCYTELGELDAAMTHVNRAIDNSPADHVDRWRYFERRGDLLHRTSGGPAAVPDWERSIELNKENTNLYFKLAEAYAGQEQYGRARYYLDQAIERDRNNVDYLYLAGLYWMKENNPMEAAKLFDRVLRLDRNHPEALYNAFLCAQHSGRLALAEEYLSRYLELRPDDKNARRQLERVRSFLR
ncbi:tetratricopeptide repeat protein [bacterium]|nr:tetratricopeptide repeat protein [bacterium]